MEAHERSRIASSHIKSGALVRARIDSLSRRHIACGARGIRRKKALSRGRRGECLSDQPSVAVSLFPDCSCSIIMIIRPLQPTGRSLPIGRTGPDLDRGSSLDEWISSQSGAFGQPEARDPKSKSRTKTLPSLFLEGGIILPGVGAITHPTPCCLSTDTA